MGRVERYPVTVGNRLLFATEHRVFRGARSRGIHWGDVGGAPAISYVVSVALDDDAEIDPATLPENVGLLQEADAQIAAAMLKRQRSFESRLADAISDAVSGIEALVLARSGKYAREEELRGGIAHELRSRGELVLTEARLAVPGWTSNLGGFDLGVVIDNSLVVGETKWADGNLYECMWDMFKLGSALALERVDAAVAVYGAPVRHWQNTEGCGRLFEDREVLSRDLIRALPREWQINLDGSSAKPNVIPMRLRLRLLIATTCDVLGKSWQIRAVGVTPDGGGCYLTDGWPPDGRPDAPTPYQW